MTHQEIVNKVKDILNEHGEVDALSISDDRVQLENYIAVAIPDAVVMLASKGYRVNAVEFAKRNTSNHNIDLPTDFISLVSIKLGKWKKAVTKITEVGSPEYNMAMNPYTAPGVNSPMCYKQGWTLVCIPDLPVGSGYDAFKLECNVKYNPYNDKGRVDPMFVIGAEEKEATAVCYMAAALVLGMFGDDQGKQRLSDISTNLLN
ncbi:MAG: hypothetical protein UHZ01_03835 [Prevotella sp.]|nr:hypothetical protein [Prevotella sp.]